MNNIRDLSSTWSNTNYTLPYVWCPVSLAEPGGWWGSAGTCILHRENRVKHLPTKAVRTERALNHWMYSGCTELINYTVDLLSVLPLKWMYLACLPVQWMYWCLFTCTVDALSLFTCTVDVLSLFTMYSGCIEPVDLYSGNTYWCLFTM